MRDCDADKTLNEGVVAEDCGAEIWRLLVMEHWVVRRGGCKPVEKYEMSCVQPYPNAQYCSTTYPLSATLVKKRASHLVKFFATTFSIQAIAPHVLASLDIWSSYKCVLVSYPGPGVNVATKRIKALYTKNRLSNDFNGFSKHHLGEGRRKVITMVVT